MIASKLFLPPRPRQARPVMISGAGIATTSRAARCRAGPILGLRNFRSAARDTVSFGLNCALGAGELRQYVEELSHRCDCFVSAIPTPACRTRFGGYDETPAQLAAEISHWAQKGLCQYRRWLLRHLAWSTLRRRRGAVRAGIPRRPAASTAAPPVGLEPFNVGSDSLFRTSVSGPTSPARASSPG